MADTATEIALATTVLSSTASSITFSGISGSYTDLRIVLYGSATYTEPNYGNLFLRLNSDSGSNYSYTGMDGSPNGIGPSYDLNQTSAYVGYVKDDKAKNLYYGNNIIDIFSYAGSNYKTILSSYSLDDSNVYSANGLRANVWRSTSAVTSVTLTPGDAPFRVGTTATIYGIL